MKRIKGTEWDQKRFIEMVSEDLERRGFKVGTDCVREVMRSATVVWLLHLANQMPIRIPGLATFRIGNTTNKRPHYTQGQFICMLDTAKKRLYLRSNDRAKKAVNGEVFWLSNNCYGGVCKGCSVVYLAEDRETMETLGLCGKCLTKKK